MSINPPAQGRKTADALVRGARKGFLTHAYIFEGEQGLGKREVAYYFAEALLCENKEVSPCGECECCRQAIGRNNPDLKSYSLKDIVEKDKKSIGVDDIRDIISDAYDTISGILNRADIENEIIFVDDGSTDLTYEKIEYLAKTK